MNKDELLEALKSPEGREVLREVLLELLKAHDAVVEEAIGKIAVREVDRANADLDRELANI